MSDLAVTWCLLKWIFLTINVSPSWCPAPPDYSPSLPAHLTRESHPHQGRPDFNVNQFNFFVGALIRRTEEVLVLVVF